MNKINKFHFVTLFLILLILFSVIGYYFYNSQSKRPVDIPNKVESQKQIEKKVVKEKPDSKKIILERAGLAEKIDGVDIELPSEETFKLAGSKERKLEKWLEVLDKKDREGKKYIILPKQGLVMPVNYTEKDSQEYKNFINGKNIDINSFLENGAFELPGTSINGYGENGNKVISGHSSYLSEATGRYKTHFQKIIELNKGDQIWIYEKNDDGDFMRYAYIVEETYNTPKDDVSILQPTADETLTLFTCTPIGSLEGRWIVKSKFLGKYKN